MCKLSRLQPCLPFFGTFPPRRVSSQLSADCGFLEDIRVMDYSLLMGVHCRYYGETSGSPLNTDKVRACV